MKTQSTYAAVTGNPATETFSAVNREKALFMDDKGNVWPITNWFDEDGEPCGSAEAFSAVAGEGSDWFALDLTEFNERLQ